MTALRQEMLDAKRMQLRGLSVRTQESYVQAVSQLARHCHKPPDRIVEEELRQYFLYLKNVRQVAVVYDASQDQAQELIQVTRSAYRPNLIVAVSAYPPSKDAPPLLMNRPPKEGQATVYVCENFVCRLPVVSSAELEKML